MHQGNCDKLNSRTVGDVGSLLQQYVASSIRCLRCTDYGALGTKCRSSRHGVIYLPGRMEHSITFAIIYPCGHVSMYFHTWQMENSMGFANISIRQC